MKIPNLIRKLSYVEVTKIDIKNESSICETVKKEKEISDSFPVTTETAELRAVMHSKHLVKMEKALNLYQKIFWERVKVTRFTQL